MFYKRVGFPFGLASGTGSIGSWCILFGCMINRTIFGALLLGVALCAVSVSATEPTPKEGERIVLLGNGFIEREQNYGHFETALQLRFPKQDLANFQAELDAFVRYTLKEKYE